MNVIFTEIKTNIIRQSNCLKQKLGNKKTFIIIDALSLMISIWIMFIIIFTTPVGLITCLCNNKKIR